MSKSPKIECAKCGLQQKFTQTTKSLIPNEWALPHICGALCPSCYGELQSLREKVNQYEQALLRDWWPDRYDPKGGKVK